MQLFHTSPTEIRKITNDGMFGSFLFFSGHVYTMTAAEALVYSVDIDDDSIIEARQIYYMSEEDLSKIQPIIDEIVKIAGVDEGTAFDLICERESVFGLDGIDSSDAGELAWSIQHATARAARALGYRGVQVTDEQGTAYMIDMMGRETELVRE